MKTLVLMILSIISFTLLTSCGALNGGCGNPNGCWKQYFVTTNTCGKYTKSVCEPICNRCTFNEPECRICWDCMNRDGCGYNMSCVSSVRCCRVPIPMS